MLKASAVWHDLQQIRLESPLVHNITNYVAMNTTANALLAVGASPVMAHAIEEVEEMAALARAVVLNLGTLSPPWIDAMVKAGMKAKQLGRPVILDPVGCGATRFRTTSAKRLLLEVSPSIIRGNASEIMSLVQADGAPKGVDSTHGSEDGLKAAKILAERYHCVVTVSGAVDLVVGQGGLARISNGHPLMPKVTGLGCTATALTGAFAAVNPSLTAAAAHAMAVMGIAGELAAERSPGPGSFQVHFLDALHQLQEADVVQRLRAS